MNVHVFLADYASATPDGKLTAVGMGWTFINPGQVMYSTVVLIEVDWTESNQPHHLEVAMLDCDGHPFVGPDGNAVRAEADFEVGRPPGHPAGVGFVVPFPLTHMQQLPPNSRFEWAVTIDGHSEPGWRATFTTRSESPEIRLAG